MMPVASLLALVSNDLSPGEAEAVETHLLGCTACSALAEALAAVGRGIDRLVRAGGVRAALTAGAVERLRAERLPSREYHIAPGQVVPCGIGAAELFNLVALEVDPGAAQRIDLLWIDATGQTLERIEDAPVDHPTRTLWVIEMGDALRRLPSLRLTARLIGVARDGTERALGDYGLDHTGFAG